MIVVIEEYIDIESQTKEELNLIKLRQIFNVLLIILTLSSSLSISILLSSIITENIPLFITSMVFDIISLILISICGIFLLKIDINTSSKTLFFINMFIAGLIMILNTVPHYGN